MAKVYVAVVNEVAALKVTISPTQNVFPVASEDRFTVGTGLTTIVIGSEMALHADTPAGWSYTTTRTTSLFSKPVVVNVD